MKHNYVKQLESLIEQYEQAKQRSKYDDLSDLNGEASAITTKAEAVIERICGVKSIYYGRIKYELGLDKMQDDLLKSIMGIVVALKDDLEAGYLTSLIETINSENFGDFLERADHLLSKNYKDAAAVIAGCVLEVHIRKLAVKNNIQVEKKVSEINVDLVKSDVYNKLDQKQIDSWYAIRNSAAHGKYGDYDNKQVDLMITGIRSFISKYTA